MKQTTDVTIKIGALEMTLTNLPVATEDMLVPVVTATPAPSIRKPRKTRKTRKTKIVSTVLDMDSHSSYNGARGKDVGIRKEPIVRGTLQDQVIAILHRSNHKRGLVLKQIHERAKKVFPKLTQKSLAGVLKVLYDQERVFRTKTKGGKFRYKHPQQASGSFTWQQLNNQGRGDYDDQPTIDGEIVI
tara:strand:+ start:357 stop:917 length:561 start_codon:yes stop_codon:yes gene_type:complete